MESELKVEPVAWLADEDKNDQSATTYDADVAERWLNKGWKVTPLYAHPAHAPAVPVEIDRYLAGLRKESEDATGDHDRYPRRGIIDRYHNAVVAAYERGDLAALRAQQPAPQVKALEEWHEGLGDCLWWCWQDGEWLGEAPYVGSPLDLGQTVECITHSQNGKTPASRFMVGGWPGYHTHFTPLPAQPAALSGEAQR